MRDHLWRIGFIVLLAAMAVWLKWRLDMLDARQSELERWRAQADVLIEQYPEMLCIALTRHEKNMMAYLETIHDRTEDGK